jgi:hypothetical protein
MITYWYKALQGSTNKQPNTNTDYWQPANPIRSSYSITGFDALTDAATFNGVGSSFGLLLIDSQGFFYQPGYAIFEPVASGLSGSWRAGLWTTDVVGNVFKGGILTSPTSVTNVQINPMDSTKLQLQAGSGRWVQFGSVDL